MPEYASNFSPGELRKVRGAVTRLPRVLRETTGLLDWMAEELEFCQRTLAITGGPEAFRLQHWRALRRAFGIDQTTRDGGRQVG